MSPRYSYCFKRILPLFQQSVNVPILNVLGKLHYNEKYIFSKPRIGCEVWAINMMIFFVYHVLLGSNNISCPAFCRPSCGLILQTILVAIVWGVASSVRT
jgi:hypothetical protein